MTDPTNQSIIDALLQMPLLTTSRSLFVVRPSVLMTAPSIVASLGLVLDLLNDGPHALMDGTLLLSQMSMKNLSAKAATRATNVGTCVPALELDFTDETVTTLAFHELMIKAPLGVHLEGLEALLAA